jgi:hypothetical protein
MQLNYCRGKKFSAAGKPTFMPYLIYIKVKGSGYDRFYKRKNRKSKGAEKAY